jgi:anti-sigma factor RsiW
MSAHVRQTDLERLARGELSTTESSRVQRHLFDCDFCLSRLIEIQSRLARIDCGGKGVAARATSHAAAFHA